MANRKRMAKDKLFNSDSCTIYYYGNRGIQQAFQDGWKYELPQGRYLFFFAPGLREREKRWQVKE